MSVDLFTFLIAAFALAITPGPSILYVAAISLRFGTLAGIVSALGVNFGSYVLILAAAFGLYPILQSFPVIVALTEGIGGLYMIYLAVHIWPRCPVTARKIPTDSKADLRQMFTRGFITTMLNPKDILFYILFIPAFINAPEGGKAFLSLFLVLSVTYALIGIATKSLIAVFAGKAKELFASEKASAISYASSLILFALGVLAISKTLSNIT